MKIIDVFNLDAAMEQLENVRGMSFSYALMKNKKIIKQEKDTLTHILPEIPGYKDFINEVNNLLREYCVIDEGMKVFVPKRLEMLEGKPQDEFLTKLAKLHDDNKHLIVARRDQLKEYNEFLQQVPNIEFYHIKQEHIPEEVSFQELYSLIELITFPEEKQKEVEISKYEIFTNLDLFNVNSSYPPLRNKLLQNALIFKKASQELLLDPVVVAWQEYEKQRKQLAESFAEKDAYGDVLVTGSQDKVGNQYLIEDRDSFQTALNELNVKFEPELTAFYALLAEKQTISVVEIHEEDLPTDLSLKELKSLDLFLA